MTPARTWVHTSYSAIVDDVTGDMMQQTGDRKTLPSMKRTVKALETILEETLYKHCTFYFNTEKYYLLEHIVKDKRSYGAIFFKRQPIYAFTMCTSRSHIKDIGRVYKQE